MSHARPVIIFTILYDENGETKEYLVKGVQVLPKAGDIVTFKPKKESEVHSYRVTQIEHEIGRYNSFLGAQEMSTKVYVSKV